MARALWPAIFAMLAGCAAARLPAACASSSTSSGTAPAASRPLASASPSDDVIFHRDPRWVGGDAAYSIDLGAARSLWLFQDTLISTTGDGSRGAVKMVRNSIGLQTGRDPATASMRFLWGAPADAAPRSYFAEDGADWTWPFHGIRISGRLIVFLSVMRKVPGKPNFDFAPARGRIAIIDRPDDDPASWAPRLIDLPAPPFDAVLGAAVVEDEGHLVILGTRFEGTHAGYLARVRASDLVAGRVDLAWWTGAGWTPQGQMRGAPAIVIDDASPECSIHFDASRRRWVHVASRGFGATSIAVRFAERLTGPWTSPVDVYKPRESEAPHVFVYAGKAHPELVAPGGGLLVTYATNAEDFWTLFKPEGKDLYWPRFVRVELP